MTKVNTLRTKLPIGGNKINLDDRTVLTTTPPTVVAYSVDQGRVS